MKKMIVLTSVNFEDKEKMSLFLKTFFFLKALMGSLTERKPRTGLDIQLEPTLRNSTSSNTRTVHAQGYNIGWI